MISPCPRCGVPGPVVVSSDGALPPDLVMADEVARLREALEHVITKCHHEWCGESAVSEAFCDSCKVARAALGRTTK